MAALFAYLAAVALMLRLIDGGLIPAVIVLLVWFVAGFLVPWVFARDDPPDEPIPRFAAR